MAYILFVLQAMFKVESVAFSIFSKLLNSLSDYILNHDGHLLLYTLSHVEPSGNAPVRPGYNELSVQLATAACHVQRPNRNSLTETLRHRIAKLQSRAHEWNVSKNVS
jgi:hypothetical protein